MNTTDIIKALVELENFSNGDRRKALIELGRKYEGKGVNEIPSPNKSIYEAAQIIKKASAQINEIVHAFGIINCLPFILRKDEIIESLSLGSGASGNGIDLVTDIRIAEFKFSEWQNDNSNGTRRRAVFSDYVSLLLKNDLRKKELYVFDADKIVSFLQSKEAKWENVLSRHSKLLNELQSKGIKGEYLCDVYSPDEIEIRNIKDYLNA